MNARSENTDVRPPRWTLTAWLSLAAAMVLVFFVRFQVMSLEGLENVAARRARTTGADPAALLAEIESESTFRTADGRRFRYTQGDDSYLWLRLARAWLEKGSTCDEVVDGQCRDNHSNAPVGREQRYGSSFHVIALAWVHRVFSWFDPGRPLMASAPWLSILLGVAGVIPAFAIGRRLAGNVAGLVAGLLAMIHPDLLWRSSGADNDAWNIVLPLFAAWMVVEASLCATLGRALLFVVASSSLLVLHSWVWLGWVFGFVVLLAGLVGQVGLTSCTLLVTKWRGDQERFSRLVPAARRASILLAGLATLTLVGVAVLHSTEVALEIPRDLASTVLNTFVAVSPAPAAGPTQFFPPDIFATVAELQVPAMFDASSVGGPVLFFFAWLGVLLLLLPPDRLETWHFALLVVANLVFRQVWGNEALTPVTFALLLFGPMAVAMAAISWLDRDSDDYLTGPVFLVIAWFLIAAIASRENVRFRMFLAPPFALAAGVFFGRLHGWVHSIAGPWVFESLAKRPASVGKKARVVAAQDRLRKSVAHGVTVVQALVFLVGAVALTPAWRVAIEILRDPLPSINTAWVDLLGELREKTPPETIVTSAWDFGYWIEYFAERATTGDGGSLLTLTPHWGARALLATSDAETAGLIRMLHCGSAAVDGPEAERSAQHRLVAAGLHPSYAPYFLTRLASLTKDEAAELLATESIVGEQAAHVIEATHCKPPPSVVIVTSRLVGTNQWLRQGGWDFRRAYVAYAAVAMEPDRATESLTRDLRYSPEETRRLLAEVAKLRPEEVETRFITNPGGLVKTDWTVCSVSEDGRTRTCPLKGFSSSGRRLESVEYSVSLDGSPEGVSVRFAGPNGTSETKLPDLVLVDDGTGVRPSPGGPGMLPAEGPSRDLGVLIDLRGHRVLAGTTAVLTSGLTRLLFLDDSSSPSFRRIAERGATGKERLVAWRLRD